MTIGLDIVTGLLGSIVHDGIKRPFKKIFDAGVRQRGIEKALLHGGGGEKK